MKPRRSTVCNHDPKTYSITDEKQSKGRTCQNGEAGSNQKGRQADKLVRWNGHSIFKPNGKIGICVDLTKLNENVCRETYPLPKIDALLGEIGKSIVFTKIEANSGFGREKLAENSQLLTTFLIAFGRHCFHQLPFGLKSAPKRFQKRMLNELEGLEGVMCITYDILVHGKTQKIR